MKQPALHVFSLVLCSLCATGCDLGSSQVLLTVDDPSGLARRAKQLSIGPTPGAGAEIRDLAEHEFPLTMTLTSSEELEGPVWIDAFDGNKIFARGSVAVRFERASVGSANVVLRRFCRDSIDCDDGTFCNGPEVCESGLCVKGRPPCPEISVACAEIQCREETSGCLFAIAPQIDDHNPCTVDGCDEGVPFHEPDPRTEGLECFTSSTSSAARGRCTSGVCR